MPERPATERGLVVDVAGLGPGLADHGLHPPVDLQEVGAHHRTPLHGLVSRRVCFRQLEKFTKLLQMLAVIA